MTYRARCQGRRSEALRKLWRLSNRYYAEYRRWRAAFVAEQGRISEDRQASMAYIRRLTGVSPIDESEFPYTGPPLFRS